MKLASLIGALTAALLLATGAQAQAPQEMKPAKAAPSVSVAPPITPQPGPSLTKQDVEAGSTATCPTRSQRGDIAGAVVVVVKDGQVLIEKGYGYADVKPPAGRSEDAPCSAPARSPSCSPGRR